MPVGMQRTKIDSLSHPSPSVVGLMSNPPSWDRVLTIHINSISHQLMLLVADVAYPHALYCEEDQKIFHRRASREMT